MNSHSIEIKDAYEVCRTITFTYAKTFSFASYFIAKDKRNACYAVYAFCRYVDDLVDVAMEQGNVTREDAVRLVSQWKSDLDDVYLAKSQQKGDPTISAILLAWEDTLSRYHIPRTLPDELIEGVLMDTTITRFETFDDLWTYCYHVASVVGLMTSEIFGYSSPDALPRAIDLGVAMQLTNIIRDVKEDADRGRIYLAQEDLRRFNVSESDILNGDFTPNVKALIQYYVERAESYYASADKGIPMLSDDSRLTVLLMSKNYRRILRVVESMEYNVFIRRASTSLFTKILSLPSGYLEARRLR
ncbi:MAG: phytoene/squalene synthase family protein [Candidatus Kapabacteria bacterium]|nr:phytoene/squalene synthase family protein [Candidatus Kapabacteria bacterium]